MLWYQLTSDVYAGRTEQMNAYLAQAQLFADTHHKLTMPRLRLAIAIARLASNIPAEARKCLLPITAFKAVELKPSMQRSINLVQLIIEFESENYERMESLIRAFNRKNIRKDDRLQTEKAIIQMLNAFRMQYDEQFREKVEKTISQLEFLKQQRYERPLFVYFDAHWWCTKYYAKKFKNKPAL